MDKIVGLLWTHLHQYTISGELTDEQMVKLSQQLDGWSAWLVEYAVSSRAQSWTPSKKTALVQRYKRSSILFYYNTDEPKQNSRLQGTGGSTHPGRNSGRHSCRKQRRDLGFDQGGLDFQGWCYFFFCSLFY